MMTTEFIKPKTKRESRVLAYCNRLRKRHKRPPVEGFVPGIIEEGRHCVLARTIEDCDVGEDAIYCPLTDIRDPDLPPIPTPLYIEAFIRDFDAGKFPHLEVYS